MGHLLQPARPDAVRALLVFLYLLEAEAECGTQLLLAHCKHLAAHPHTPADMLVDGVRGHLSRQTVSEPPWLTARYMSKNRPDAGTFDIPIQRAIFGQKVRGTSRNVRHKHHRRQKSSA